MLRHGVLQSGYEPCRVVLVVGDKLWDAVEQVFFCQVILVLGGAADDIVADRALGVCRGLGIDGDSVFPCLAGGISDNEAPFLTLKQKGQRALGGCGDCVSL